MKLLQQLREEMFIDSQGRRVRKKHAIRDLRELPSGKQEQLVLWVDISDATGEQMLKAFQYRRRLVLGDCAQLKTDVDSFNENNRHNAFIEMCLDFTEDLAEPTLRTEHNLQGRQLEDGFSEVLRTAGERAGIAAKTVSDPHQHDARAADFTR